MENDKIYTAVTTDDTGTIVLNGAEVHGLCSIPVSQPTRVLEEQLAVSGAAPGFLSDNTVLVDTTRGLLVSVPDGAGGLTYGRLTASVGLQQSASLLVSCAADSLVDTRHTVFVSGGNGDGLSVAHQPLAGNTELQIADYGALASQTAQPIHLTTAGVEDEPKKRKGGWPKGKKRKNSPELNTPRAPVTGYVLYAIERRHEIKKSHPDLQFSEVTKVLGNEWSSLQINKKQKYLMEAEADKKRYIDELNAFQQSATFQNFLKKRRLKGVCGVDPNGLESDAYSTLIDLEEDYMSELYCRVCDQYFSSLHNKKEHMFGRQHLQAITCELEKELDQQQNEQQELQRQQSLQQSGLSASGDVNHDSLGSLSDSSDSDLKLSNPIDVEGFIQDFHLKNKERDQEIRQLKRSLKMSQLDNLAMCKQIQEYKELETKLEQDIGNAKAYGASLTAQIDGLKMVPTLFGVITCNF